MITIKTAPRARSSSSGPCVSSHFLHLATWRYLLNANARVKIRPLVCCRRRLESMELWRGLAAAFGNLSVPLCFTCYQSVYFECTLVQWAKSVERVTLNRRKAPQAKKHRRYFAESGAPHEGGISDSDQDTKLNRRRVYAKSISTGGFICTNDKFLQAIDGFNIW
jgi:hypothetical protein